MFCHGFQIQTKRKEKKRKGIDFAKFTRTWGFVWLICEPASGGSRVSRLQTTALNRDAAGAGSGGGGWKAMEVEDRVPNISRSKRGAEQSGITVEVRNDEFCLILLGYSRSMYLSISNFPSTHAQFTCLREKIYRTLPTSKNLQFQSEIKDKNQGSSSDLRAKLNF